MLAVEGRKVVTEGGEVFVVRRGQSSSRSLLLCGIGFVDQTLSLHLVCIEVRDIAAVTTAGQRGRAGVGRTQATEVAEAANLAETLGRSVRCWCFNIGEGRGKSRSRWLDGFIDIRSGETHVLHLASELHQA
jgi:hypothetical protein